MAERRSNRIAGKRPESAPADSKTPTTDRKKKKQSKAKPEFDAGDVADAIISGANPSVLDKLTKGNLKAVLETVVGRYHEEAQRAAEARSWTRLRVDAALARHRPEAPAAVLPAAAAENPADDDDNTADTTPAAGPEAESIQPPAETPPPRRTLMDRAISSVRGFFTPSPAQQPQQSLGQLPTNRKRPAPEQEPEVTEPANTINTSTPTARPSRTTSAPMATPRTRAPPPSANTPFNTSAAPDVLDTISERTEESEASIRGTPAPRTNETPRNRRGIAQVREKQRLQEIERNQTPLRAWERTPLPPRRSNADLREWMIKRCGPIKEEIRFEYNPDIEVEEYYERPVKRVKVDEIREIPHRRPGQPKSTFSVPEVDSDGEMDVDEDVEMGGNVFTPPHVQDTQQITSIEQNTGDNSNSPSVGEPQEEEITTIDQNTGDNSNLPSVGELQEDEPEEDDIIASEETWNFPSVGERPADQESDEEENEFLAAKFAYGFEGWLRGERVVEW